MSDAKSRPDLSGILEQRRRELSDRPDVSARMRRLSASNSRNPLPASPRKRPTLLRVILAGLAVALLLACAISAAVAVASGVWFRNQLSDPSQTALDFYSALHQQDYARAYGFFSDGAKSRLSQSAFQAQFSAYDSVSGIVESYTTEGSTSVQGSTAVVTIDVVRRLNTSQAQVQTIHLVNQNGSWTIDRIELGKTIPVPNSSQ
ncbi:MAG TPA: hypothetical protein VH591_03645 [Ktedonobacterales bacterium]